jgi:nucleotide-binding universal stress UspA family protein
MKILLAVDDSKFSEAATQALIRQMKPNGAEVCVMHVVEPLLLMPDFRPGTIEELQASEERFRKRGEELTARAAEQLRAAGYKAHTVVKEGDTRAEIIDYAAHWGADLIVLGSHGWKGLDRFLMGSVAEYVSRHAKCSVQIVRIQRHSEA